MNNAEKEKIRVIALAVLYQADHIFVTEFIDSITGEPYYRPLGGGVEFYETGEDAVRRELHEEINADVINVRYMGMLENIFTAEGGRGHQICLMYRATFAEPHHNATDYRVEGLENGHSFKAMWKPIAMFRAGNAPLYPNGLLHLLNSSE